MLGAVSGRTSAPSKGLTPVPDTSSRTTTGAPTTAASTTTTYATTEPTPVRTESAATISTAGASTAEAPQTYMGSAMAALGAIVGGAATAVENATGVNLGQSHQPVSSHVRQKADCRADLFQMTVDEAESKGINVDSLEKKDAPTDTVSPAGTAPSNSYVAALEEKMDGLKTTDTTGAGSSLPNGGASSSTEHLLRQYPADLPDLSASYDNAPTPLPADDKPEYDIPAQVDTGDNHNHVPMPVITDMSERDPKKDRTLDSTTNSDSVGTKPITSDPSVSAEAAKKDAEANPGTTGSTGAAAAGLIPEGTTVAKPDAKSANLDAPAPATTSSAATPADDTATKISAAAATTSPGMAGTTPATTGKAAVTPATPAKGAALIATPASPQSNTSTPAKPAHKKETTDADMRKRKSSFFGKVRPLFNL